MALGLRKSGCSTGATLAYWLGNPLLNPATMVFMGFVLGWRWVGLRLAVGIVLVFTVAYLVGRFAPRDAAGREALRPEPESAAGDAGTGNVWARWLRALRQLSVGLIPEYVVLLLALGAARAWLFPAVTPGATGIGWTVGLALAGTLFVIPTAGEIPIVQTLLAVGLGAGPAAALLTTLPPVSLPSLVMLGKAFPAPVLVFVGSAVFVLGLLSGAAAVALGF